MTNSEIRAQARQNMKGNWGLGIGAWLIYAVILGGVSMIPYIGWIGTVILTGPLACGLYCIYLRFARAHQTQISDLFSGFQYFGNSFLAGLLVNLFTFLWSLLFIIPGIVKNYAYSMTYYILCDDPTMDGNTAITKSREMMDGHKMDLFMLQLSFIGWILLGIVTCGIAMIYVVPYMLEAETIFYNNLRPNQPTDTEEKPSIDETLHVSGDAETQQEQPAQEAQPEEAAKFCPGCGNKLKEDETFCPLCGIKVK